MPRSALIVEVPEAEPLVADWRARYDWSAQHGVPAHVTVLFPFVPVSELDGEIVAALEGLFASVERFRFALPRVARFADVAWLAPDPDEPFRLLTELVADRFPDYPPYEGIHDEVIPHLTVAEGGVELQDEVEAVLASRLPIEASVEEVTLIVEDDAGWWRADRRFPLAESGRRRP